MTTLRGGGWGPNGSRVSQVCSLVHLGQFPASSWLAQPGCGGSREDAPVGTVERCLRQQHHTPVELATTGCRKLGPSQLPSCLSANAPLIKQQPEVAETRAVGEMRFSFNRFPSPAHEREEKPFSCCQINTQVVFPPPFSFTFSSFPFPSWARDAFQSQSGAGISTRWLLHLMPRPGCCSCHTRAERLRGARNGDHWDHDLSRYLRERVLASNWGTVPPSERLFNQ